MTAATLSGVAAAFGLPDQALAHALQGRSDLPLPIWLFAWGASLVLILSFVLFAVLWQKPRLQEEQWRPVAPVLGKLLCGRVARLISGMFGIACLFLVVYSGLAGVQDAALNFSVTFVFVTFWIGVPVISAIFGNLFAYLSPWRALAEWVARATATLGMKGAGLAYPERLGRWPAVVVLILFGWLELIGGAGISLITPETVAILALAYTVWTFLGMYLFGIRVWSERGEAFAVYFEMFSRLSSLELRGGVLGVRKFLSGVPSWSTPAGSAALVLVAIGITTFDGAQEGAMQSVIGDTT
ncbi:MAG: fenitrothion hydrolase, partial [bacterium]